MPSKSLGTIVLSDEMIKLIENTSRSNNISRETAITRAFALLKISNDAKSNGMSLGVIEEGENGSRVVSIIKDA